LGDYFPLHRVFSALQVLIITYCNYQCELCGYKSGHTATGYPLQQGGAHAFAKCARKLVAPVLPYLKHLRAGGLYTWQGSSGSGSGSLFYLNLMNVTSLKLVKCNN